MDLGACQAALAQMKSVCLTSIAIMDIFVHLVSPACSDLHSAQKHNIVSIFFNHPDQSRDERLLFLFL
jgi:hypothetical protein